MLTLVLGLLVGTVVGFAGGHHLASATLKTLLCKYEKELEAAAREKAAMVEAAAKADLSDIKKKL